MKFFFVFLVFLTIFLRFWAPGLIFFNTDEALYLNSAELNKLAQVWPAHGAVGNVGMTYGPVAFWIYQSLSYFLVDLKELPTLAFYFNASCHLLSFAYLLAGFKKLFSPKVFICLALLMITSPHLLFYSRTIWDNPYLIMVSNIAGGLIIRDVVAKSSATVSQSNFNFRGWGLWCCFGVLAAVAMGIHLMSAPLIGVMIVYGFYRSYNQRWLRLLGPIIMLLIVAGILFPYIASIIQIAGHSSLISQTGEAPRPFKISRIFTGARDVLAEWSGWVSWSGFSRYFMDRTFNNFSDFFSMQVVGESQFLTVTLKIVLGFLAAIQVIWAVMIVTLPIWMVRRRSWEVVNNNRDMVFVAVGLIFLHLVMADILDTTTHPHYFQAVWWAPFICFGIWLENYCFIFNKILPKIILMVVAGNASLNVFFYQVLRQGHGYPSTHLGPTFEEQSVAMDRLCKKMSRDHIQEPGQKPGQKPGQELGQEPVRIDRNMTIFSGDAVQWMSRHVESCKGHTIELVDLGTRLQTMFLPGNGAQIYWNWFNDPKDATGAATSHQIEDGRIDGF